MLGAGWCEYAVSLLHELCQHIFLKIYIEKEGKFEFGKKKNLQEKKETIATPVKPSCSQPHKPETLPGFY